MSDQSKCQGCGVTASWKDGKPFDALVATDYDESARNVIWSCTDCIFMSGLGEPKEVPVAARCYRWVWGEKCSKPRRSTTNHWKFGSDECCDIMRKEVEACDVERNEHQPTKGDTAPMRNHKHYGTPQDNSFIGDIVRFIAQHGGLRDWEKDLLINRITIPTAGLDSPEVLRAMEGTSEPYPQQPSDVPDQNPTHDAPSNPAPCPLSIIQDADDTFFVVIGDRKWKICRHGIIGINKTERLEFAAAVEKAAGRELEFTNDIEVIVPYGIHSYLQGRDHEYKKLLASRGSTDTSLGQIAYESFQSSDALRGESAPLPWDELPKDGPVCAAWELLGAACYHSSGSWPDDTEKTIQVLAARKRLQLLKDTGQFGLKEGTDFAVFLNEIAGPSTKV